MAKSSRHLMVIISFFVLGVVVFQNNGPSSPMRSIASNMRLPLGHFDMIDYLSLDAISSKSTQTNQFTKVPWNLDYRTDSIGYIRLNPADPWNFEFYNVTEDKISLRYELLGKMIRRFQENEGPPDRRSLGSYFFPRVAFDGYRWETNLTVDRFERTSTNEGYEPNLNASVSERFWNRLERTSLAAVDSRLNDCLKHVTEWNSKGGVYETMTYCRGFGLVDWHWLQNYAYTIAQGAVNPNELPQQLRDRPAYFCHQSVLVRIESVQPLQATRYSALTFDRLGPAEIVMFQDSYGHGAQPFINCIGSEGYMPPQPRPRAIAETTVLRILSKRRLDPVTFPYYKTHPAVAGIPGTVEAYRQALNRTPSVSEALSAAAKIATNQTNELALKNQLARSEEGIRALYVSNRGRQPNAAEIANLLKGFSNGLTPEAVASSLLLTEEAVQISCREAIGKACNPDAVARFQSERSRSPSFAMTGQIAQNQKSTLALSDIGLEFHWNQYMCRSILGDEIQRIRQSGRSYELVLSDLQRSREVVNCQYKKRKGVAPPASVSNYYTQQLQLGEMVYPEFLDLISNEN